MDGFQVLRRHDVFVFDVEPVARVAVGNGVASAANLTAGTAVGAGACFVQAQVAFARNCHAQSAVAKHLYSHRVAVRAADAVAHDGLMYVVHLLEVHLAGKHHHVGKLAVESHRLAVRYVHLRGDVHLHVDAAGVGYGSHIACNDGRDAGFFGGVDDAAHQLHIVVEHHRVHCEIAFHAALVAPCCNLVQVVDGEVVRRFCTHIQPLDAKIYGIGTTLMRCHKTLVAAHRRHYLKIFSFHVG